MNETEVTREGQRHLRPGREALVGPPSASADAPRRRRGGGGRGERAMVPEAEFRSYYGQPILNKPVWESRDIAGYLFLGGLAGAGSVVAAGAQLTGRTRLARAMKLGSFVAVNLSLAALIHDLGRPARFLNMLRVVKPTSPMSVGTWLLSAFGTASAASALTEVTGAWAALGAAGTTGAALLGCPVAAYTAALIANTAVPAWHDARRDLPWVFVSSAATSAAGFGLVCAPATEAGPVRALGVLGGLAELGTEEMMERRMGLAAEAFEDGKARRWHQLARGLLVGGVVAALLPWRSRVRNVASGLALLFGSAFTRFAIFEAGVSSAQDPRYTVLPQRQRLDARSEARD